MNEQEILDRAKQAAMSVVELDQPYDALLRRRDRKRRNQRITAGVVGIAVFVAAVWIVTSVGSVDRTQPAVPGGAETGPTPTPPAGTAPETTGYLMDLNTGQMTQLPKSISGGELYAVSPDGTMVAFTSGDDTGTRQVFIANLDGTDVQQVTHDRDGAAFPDWSPDGAAIAYTTRAYYTSGDVDKGNIFVLDLATGETSQVTNEKPTTEPLAHPGFPQFSPDGASIIYEVNRGDGWGMRIVPVTGGKSVLLVGGGKNDVEAWTGTLSPDGSTLAVACSGRLEGICIADADGTNLRTLVSGLRLNYPRWSPDGTRIAYTSSSGGNKVFVVDVATGEATDVADGIASDWLDDHTLIVECACR
jgi:Tol biopolymer transport system component